MMYSNSFRTSYMFDHISLTQTAAALPATMITSSRSKCYSTVFNIGIYILQRMK
jgi:hypothetical protein